MFLFLYCIFWNETFSVKVCGMKIGQKMPRPYSSYIIHKLVYLQIVISNLPQESKCMADFLFFLLGVWKCHLVAWNCFRNLRLYSRKVFIVSDSLYLQISSEAWASWKKISQWASVQNCRPKMSTCWRNSPQSTAFHTFRITVVPWRDGHIITRVTTLLMVKRLNVSDYVRWITTVTSEQIKWFISLISWSVLHIISEIVVEHYKQNLTTGDNLDECHLLPFWFYTRQTSTLHQCRCLNSNRS